MLSETYFVQHGSQMADLIESDGWFETRISKHSFEEFSKMKLLKRACKRNRVSLRKVFIWLSKYRDLLGFKQVTRIMKLLDIDA